MLRVVLAAAAVLLSQTKAASAQPVAAAAPPPSPPSPSSPQKPAVREVCGTGGVLNLRSGPSMQAKVIDKLPDEFDLVVIGSSGSGEWLHVRDEGGRTGWVASRYTCADDGKDSPVGPWRHPAPGACVTSPFGPRTRPCGDCSRDHRGVDLAVCESAVGAAAAGRVVNAAWDRKGGNYVAVDHGAGLVSYYLHLKECSVKPGDQVAAGAKVGIAGRTGIAATGCHLHFEVRQNGRSIDPAPLLASNSPPAG